MTTSIVVGAISAEANRLATHLLHQLLPTRRSFSTPCVRIPASQADTTHRQTSLLRYTRMLTQAAQQSGRNHLGLEMARAQTDLTDSIFGPLFLYAPTVGDALYALTQYFPVGQTGTLVKLTHAHGVSRLSYEINDPSIDERLQDAAYTLGKIHQSLRTAAGEVWQPQQVTLAASAAHGGEAYRHFFQAPVQFEAASSSLCFASSLLERPILTADTQRYANFCARLKRLMPHPHSPHVLEDALRAWLTYAVPRRQASLEMAAADFGATPRTLQRRLKDQDIRFQDLLATVRMEHARLLLADSALPITHIAEQLGYSETSAFTRAFRGHTQLSPSAYRQSTLATA